MGWKDQFEKTLIHQGWNSQLAEDDPFAVELDVDNDVHRSWSDVEQIEAMASIACRSLAVSLVDSLRWHLHEIGNEAQSPIEVAMFCGLLAQCVPQGFLPSLPFGPEPFAIEPDTPFSFPLKIELQQEVGDYRVDFLLTALGFVFRETERGVVATDTVAQSLVVECDGHEFHEKTKKQASKDKKRDRDLQRVGLLVARFSGSDIWADPNACAREALQMLKAGLRAKGAT